MPTYTYQCDDCGERFDTRQSFSDDPLEDCQLCQAEGSVHRVIQATGIIFKGSGFYVTDNSGASKTATNGSKAESNGSDAKSESTDTKSDTTSSASSEPKSKTA